MDTSSIRKKYRPKAFGKIKTIDQKSDEYVSRFLDSQNSKHIENSGKNRLVSLLPKPKNQSAFGPTIKLEDVLKLHKPIDMKELILDKSKVTTSTCPESDVLEVDMKKIINSDTSYTTHEELRPNLPKGKEKQKNQITYLAKLSQANELELKEKAAESRANKFAARSKYGW